MFKFRITLWPLYSGTQNGARLGLMYDGQQHLLAVGVPVGVLSAVYLGGIGEGWCFKRCELWPRVVVATAVVLRFAPVHWYGWCWRAQSPLRTATVGFSGAAVAACGSKLFHVQQLRVQLSVGGLEGGVEGWKCAGIL